MASAGLNLAIDFLPGAVGYDRTFAVSREEAARVLWLDAYVANVDRSARNTNLLIWHKRLWAIDHGACLRFHHAWGSPEAFADGGLPLRRPRAGRARRPAYGARGAGRAGHRRRAGDDHGPGAGRLAASPTRQRPDPQAPADAAAARHGLPRLPAGPAGRRRPVAAVTGVPWRSSTPCCGPCRGSTGASSSTSA